MNKIDFSIIIPVYNSEYFLERCINSILLQKYEKWELILVNDGSTDNSLAICNKYKKKDKRIKVINQKNSGVSFARNIGIQNSKGKYICFFDSDDYIDINYLSYAYTIIKKYNPDLINTGFYSCVESNKNTTIDKIYVKEKFYSNKSKLKKDLVYLWDTHMLYNVWNKIYLSDIIKRKNIKFPNYNFGEDMEFNRLYLQYVEKFYNSDKCFYYYIKERKNSLTGKYNNNLFDIRIKEYDYLNEYFEKEGLKKEEYEEFSSRRFIERILGCIENICGSDLSKEEKKTKIYEIINHKLTKTTIKKINPHSKKIFLMLIPLKLKSVYLTYTMGNMVSKIRKNNPVLFNHLKNRR